MRRISFVISPRRAGDADWEGVDEATRGADQPILSGLRYILERGLELDDDHEPAQEGWTPPKPSLSCEEAWRNCA